MRFKKTINNGGSGGSGGLRGPIQFKDHYMADIISDLGRDGKAVPIPWLYEAFVIPGHIHKKLSCEINAQPNLNIEVIFKNGIIDDWVMADHVI